MSRPYIMNMIPLQYFTLNSILEHKINEYTKHKEKVTRHNILFGATGQNNFSVKYIHKLNDNQFCHIKLL